MLAAAALPLQPDVYILAGQSNMSGRGAIAELTAAERTPDPMIRLFGNDGQWRPALEPLDSAAGQTDMVSADRQAGVGPGLFFARAMRTRGGRPIVLVPCAKGGSSIGRWKPDRSRDTLYGSCLARVRAAGGRVRGLLWYQGESDAGKPPESAARWSAAFRELVNAFRNDLGMSGLPIVYVRIGDRPDDAARYPSWAAIQRQQLRPRMPCSRIVSAEGLPRKPDRLHLTTAAQRRLGRALAEAMGRLLRRGCGSDAPAPRLASFEIAITVDDLPAHGPLPPGMTRLGIAQSYLETLAAHGVPEAYGFVNAAKIGTDPDSAAVLDAWRAAGYPLGNHGATHLNLERAPSIDAWRADVIRGEPPLARAMRGADWHWYRFPNLAAGNARHDAAAAFLGERGYRVASVSVAFSDWSYTDAYARCRARGDDAAIEAMKAAYLRGIDEGIARMRALSARIYGRMAPQVLLTHLGGWSAVMLPEVMARLDAAGARYVTLARAEADPAYVAAERLPGGGGIMDRTAHARGVDLSGLPEPRVLAGVDRLCRD